jgi:phosphoribosylanthranilate isomerase
MYKVKICGLTKVEDIAVVNLYLPEYVGFVFANSRRRVTAQQAKRLKGLLSPKIAAVGVFADEPIENIVRLIRGGVIDIIQLHGGESWDYLQELKTRTSKPVIKAVKVGEKCPPCADYLLYDGAVPGSGQGFDWGTIDNTDMPYFLAGGLTADNISAVKAKCIRRPYALDVSSGVETNGVKEASKIKEFIRRARNGE